MVEFPPWVLYYSISLFERPESFVLLDFGIKLMLVTVLGFYSTGNFRENTPDWV
jgi:hypothetical protein